MGEINFTEGIQEILEFPKFLPFWISGMKLCEAEF